MAQGCFRFYRHFKLWVPQGKKSLVKFLTTGRQSSGATRKTAGSALLLAIPVIAFGLGTWQVYRLQWKKSLIEQLKDQTMKDPTVINNNLAILEAGEMQYRRVRFRGTFDHSKEIHLFPRSQNNDNKKQTMGGVNATGAHIITPLRLSNSGEQILVNRGWVDKSKMNPKSRPEGQVTDEIEMVAFVRHGEKRPQFVPKNNIEKNQWHYRDVDQMAELTGTLPILVDADAGSTINGGPIGGQTRVTLRNEHLQYIITWYGLSFATALMYYQFRKPGGRWR